MVAVCEFRMCVYVRAQGEKRDEPSTYALDALINNTGAAPEVTNYKINSGSVAWRNMILALYVQLCLA